MAKGTVFVLHGIAQVQGEGRVEDAYIYTTEDKKRGVQFRWHSKKAFVPVLMRTHNVSNEEYGKLVGGWVRAGLAQHDYAGGFDEAISRIAIA